MEAGVIGKSPPSLSSVWLGLRVVGLSVANSYSRGDRPRHERMRNRPVRICFEFVYLENTAIRQAHLPREDPKRRKSVQEPGQHIVGAIDVRADR